MTIYKRYKNVNDFKEENRNSKLFSMKKKKNI